MLIRWLSHAKAQIRMVSEVVRTREFWVYFGVIAVLLLLAAGGIRLATSFDPMTRGMLHMSFSCRTSEGRLATIMVGSFVFGIASVVTLGEVINWVEGSRESRVPGSFPRKISGWSALAHVIGTVALGIAGYLLMLSWCS